jgi:hypothetical protein
VVFTTAAYLIGSPTKAVAEGKLKFYTVQSGDRDRPDRDLDRRVRDCDRFLPDLPLFELTRPKWKRGQAVSPNCSPRSASAMAE